MTDRDHFAAAALTGLISLNCPGPNQQFPRELCERAFRWADAMLRERGSHIADAGKMVKASGETVPPCFDPAWSKYQAWVAQNAAIVKRARERAETIHDASPAARADSRPLGNPVASAVTGTGNTQEPVAWVIQWAGEDIDVRSVFCDRESAELHVANYHGKNSIIPLYRHPQPTLTDEEREAVEWCRDNITAMAHKSSAFAYIHADTLRKMLERLA